MNLTRMLLAEIGYRKLNFLLSLIAVIVAVAMFVAGPVLIDAYRDQTDEQLLKLEDETRKLMAGMGFNLLIVHRDTDMADFWAADFATHDMPQEYIDRLAADGHLTLITHLVATLKSRIDWENRKVLLVGHLKETPQTHRALTKFAKDQQEMKQAQQKKKKPMGYDIAPGTVQLGFELGVGREAGQSIDVLGKPFKIVQILPEQGSKEDIAINMHLTDAQELLGKEGRINQILALGCKCAGESLPKIRSQLALVLPDTHITEDKTKAVARAEQRNEVTEHRNTQLGRVETLAGLITPLVVITCAIWVGLLALTNVRERRTEIGILRALGKSSTTIACLFLGKAMLVGVVGAAAGFVLGSALARWLGVTALEVAPEQFTVQYTLLVIALVGAPLLSAIASYLPTLSALMQDPATVLRDQ